MAKIFSILFFLLKKKVPQQHGQGSFNLEMFEKYCHIWRKRKFIKWLVVKIFGGFG
jgi:hypothetical protein